jgi:hypothetical protein
VSGVRRKRVGRAGERRSRPWSSDGRCPDAFRPRRRTVVHVAGRPRRPVHEPTQTEGAGLDLTVDGVHAVTSPGAIDFGGCELEPADTTALDTTKRDPDDDYGWWVLSPGIDLVTYNESLATDDALVLQPRDALVERGAIHRRCT